MHAPRRKGHRVRAFWERITEGFQIAQLWNQFKSEARASYGLYSNDVDWDRIKAERKRVKRAFLIAWGLFQAMLMKLSPARRVLLLVAVVIVVLNPQYQNQNLNLQFIGAVILFILLALELGDRVTMKRDLEIAREIQQWLVPDHPPQIPGFDIAFATRPQNTVAGDYYDAFVRPVAESVSGVRQLLIVVADVAGKSVPAALLMATFQASLRALSATPAPFEEIIGGIDNYTRAHSLDGRRFTTSWVAEINPETREMLYVNAGHNDPILRRASGQIERLATGGPPFGLPVLSEKQGPYLSGRVRLQPGDLLFIFTDGVVEAVDNGAREYGESRLMACIQSAPQLDAADTLKRVMEDVNAFVGYARQHDDITALVMRVN
ncbi:MAG: PP2C family protein-serine/threonine phosphatase [Candidatus Acidiferrales bacterium]